MSEFQAVNTTLTVAEAPPRLEESTPTTPRPTIFTPACDMATESAENAEDAAKTPTRDSFGGMANQRPLPSSPLQSAPHGHTRSDSKMEAPLVLKREGSHRSTKSLDSSQDTEMTDANDTKDGSAEASDDSGTDERPSKKKKGQRFFCTEFPPCQLSFTRSEHLARHIRKHTGERPFQCHCSRRFSRLDNLRQHAQTVHVNEDIPGDSLAATGTRFQRQIRTDRVRPPGSRARASTLGSTGSHSRGHSRNLSASSITSVSTTTSSLGGDDIMRRATPVMSMMSNEARSRLSLDTYGTTVTGSPASQHYYTVGGQSPSGYSTPTSTTFSQGTGSPRYSSGFHSPVSIPRSVNFEPRTPGRRLSVPSGNNPFTPSSNTSYPSPYLSSVQSASGNSSIFASPTSSGFGHSRRESTSSIIDSDLRRRTWHPNSHTGLIARAGISGLQQYQTPEQSRPVFPADKVTGSQTRLPGIESFDHAPPPPAAVPRRVLSPMQIDPPQQQSLAAAVASQDQMPAATQPEQRNNRMSWDSTLQRGLTNLDIARANQPERGAFSPYPQQGAEIRRPRTSHVTFQDPIPGQHPFDGNRNRHSDEPLTPHRNKRMAWYNGPVTQQSSQGSYHSAVGLRTSPDGSSSSDGVPTPSNGSLNEVNPAIVHSNGYVESAPRPPPVEDQTKMQAPPVHYPPSFSSNSIPQYTPHHHPPHQAQNATYALQHAQRAPPHPIQAYQTPPQPANDMQRLEALVAVATRENQAVGGH